MSIAIDNNLHHQTYPVMKYGYCIILRADSSKNFSAKTGNELFLSNEQAVNVANRVDKRSNQIATQDQVIKMMSALINVPLQ